jgi:hypothetical protein
MGTREKEPVQLEEIVLLSNTIIEQKEQDIKHKKQIALFHALTAEYATLKVSIEADEVDFDATGRTAKEKTKDKKRLGEIPLLIKEAEEMMKNAAVGMETVSSQALKLLDVSIGEAYPHFNGARKAEVVEFLIKEKRTAADLESFCVNNKASENINISTPKRSSLIAAKLAAIVVGLGELMKGIDSLLLEIESAIAEVKKVKPSPAPATNDEKLEIVQVGGEEPTANEKPKPIEQELASANTLFSDSIEDLERLAVNANEDTVSMEAGRTPVPFPGLQR